MIEAYESHWSACTGELDGILFRSTYLLVYARDPFLSSTPVRYKREPIHILKPDGCLNSSAYQILTGQDEYSLYRTRRPLGLVPLLLSSARPSTTITCASIGFFGGTSSAKASRCKCVKDLLERLKTLILYNSK